MYLHYYKAKKLAHGFNDGLKTVAKFIVENPSESAEDWVDDLEGFMCEESAEAEQRFTAALAGMTKIEGFYGPFMCIPTAVYHDLRKAADGSKVALDLEAAAHESGASARKRARMQMSVANLRASFAPAAVKRSPSVSK